MDVASLPPSPVPAPRPEPPPILMAWPQSAQLAPAFLLGLSTALLAIHTYGSSRWGSRPTDLQHGADLAYRIDLNQAERAELLQLPGVGESLAQRIEEYRQEHGSFRAVNDLAA